MNINEIRVFGIPGAGKTTWMARQIERAARTYGPSNVMVTSFTKAAAAELVTRDLSLPPSMVGTLHSHCYRLLGCPVIAETKVKEFNEENPGLSLSGKSASDLDAAIEDDVSGGLNYGDKLMSRLQYYRNNLVPRDEWNGDVADFATIWEDFKRQTDTKDFTDLVEFAGSRPPSDAAVGFVDEAQDLTPLQFQLIRKWGQNFKKLVVCGDDDQALYRWAGASARSMLYPEVPEESKFFLDTTWRCPRVIQDFSARWIEQIVERQPKEQKTNRDIDGELIDAGYGYTNVMALIDDVEEDIGNGKTAMILTSCSFQLAPVIRELKSRGIPFWNKYRMTRGDWNPIRKATVSRILAFLQPEYGTLDDGSKVWSLQDIKKWGAIVKWRGIMPNGFLTAVDNVITSTEDASKSDVMAAGIEFLDTWGVDKIMHADMDWLYDNAKAGKDKSLEYPMTIINKYGVDKLKDDPMVTAGTIHCSPPDEMVLTSSGWVSMFDLDPTKHGLAGYHRGTNSLLWGHNNKKEGYSFIKNVSKYNGSLITIKTEDSLTRVTPEHMIPVQFSNKFIDKYVVYLMKRGPFFRVGVCVSARRPYRSGGVGGRLATEQGDCGWILKVCETRKEAIIEEEKIRSYYGIPGLTFETAKNRSLNKKDLDEIHEHARGMVFERVLMLFRDFGLFIDQPLYTRSSPGDAAGVKKRNMRGIFVTVAANLLSVYMDALIPTNGFCNKKSLRDTRKAVFKEIVVDRKMYNGDVYSLEVFPYHFYISGGAIVHNSVKGGESASVYLSPDISKAAYRAAAFNQDCADDIIRQYYVGMTRASEKLTILQPTSQWHVKGLEI